MITSPFPVIDGLNVTLVSDMVDFVGWFEPGKVVVFKSGDY